MLPLEGLGLFWEARSAEETDISEGIKEEGTQLEKAEDLPSSHSASSARVSHPEVLSKLPQ